MPPRTQKTPHGDVTLTSRWMRDHYWLVAYGPVPALHWMFPKTERFENVGSNARHTFEPAPTPITVERDLRKICAQWQAAWFARLEDHDQGVQFAESTGDPVILTLGQLFAHLHEQRKVTMAKMTIDRDRYKLNLWREELGEATPLTALTVEKLSAALANIGKRTSPGTANVALGLLKTYLNWAANMGYLKDNRHRTVRRLKADKDERHHRDWWTAAEVDQALACAALVPNQPTATLLVACGCMLGLRVGEIVQLRWQDLNLDAIDPRTQEPNPVCHIVPHDGWRPKDGESRDIPISSSLLAILKQNRQQEGYVLMQEPKRKGRPRGGGHGLDYRYNPAKVWAQIIKRVEAAGGKRITMYGMRHSFASNLLMHSISDVKVSRWLGHSDTRMVHRHYGHLLSYDNDINVL